MRKSGRDHPIELCFRILSTLGDTGQWVWEVGKNIDDMQERTEYLFRAVHWLRAKAKSGDWERLPVDFRTFIESEHLLNRANSMWPEVMKCGEELNSGKYTESVLTGGIGVGKSHLAVYTQAYQLYVLTCMRSPHEAFDLDTASEITVIFQSVNAELAKDVDYGRFRAMVDESPYFARYAPYDEGRASDMRFIHKRIVVKPVSGSHTAALGQNVIGGILDEVNFMAVTEKSKNKKDGTTYDQAVENYNSLARRRESRFMQLGELPGMLCLVSSRNYPGQFTDKKEAEARENPRIYVYDKRVWEIRPEKYCGDKFEIFIGDETRKPRILLPDEKLAEKDAALRMRIPVEHRHQFQNDILSALRDIAGVSTQALHPFMLNIDAVSDCFGKIPSIASREDCDFVDTKIDIYPKRIVNPNEMRFAHLDLAISKDSAGFAVCHCPGFKEVNRGDHVEVLPMIQFDMILEVRPPRGDEIIIERLRKLLYLLRDTLSVPVRWVTFDQFQSNDSRQILQSKGFSTGKTSMDSTTEPYDVLKQAFYDGRIIAPTHVKALHELRTLEFDAKKNKIDHPPSSSKDVADAMAGAAYGIMRRIEIWHRHGIPLSQIPASVREAMSRSRHGEAESKAPPPPPATRRSPEDRLYG